MNKVPKWFLPVAIFALLWNLAGCLAYLADATLKPEDIAQMSAAQQAMYAARPAWSIAATAFAVWGGAAGCVGLIWRKRWALPLLFISLLGVVVQDLSMFAVPEAENVINNTVIAMQGAVLLISIALLLLARKARDNDWLS